MLLEKATPETARERDRATHAAWGGPLPVERYMAAEARIRAHPWSRAASAMWLLRSDRGEALCSCETYRMASLLRDGTAVPGHTYGIASVFTDADRRGHGHATELLDRLALALHEEDPEAQALVLYSDVVPRVYERAGFTARPALDLVFAALPGDPGEGVDEWFTEARAAQALDRLPPPEGRFAIRPEPDQVDWHLERERIYAEVLGRARPPTWGARRGGGAALWTADPRSGQLTLLLLHAPERADAEALLASARRTAFAAGLARVVLWRTPADLSWPQAGLEDRALRLDSVPMIRALDPRVRPEDWTWIPRLLWV
jgi:GNAT superfamily N-acetyltransferase